MVRTTAEYAHGDEEGMQVAQAKKIPVVQPGPGLLRIRNEFAENDLKHTVGRATSDLHLTDAAEFITNYRRRREEARRAAL